METKVRVGPKYQVVIPTDARKVARKIKLGKIVTVTPLDDESVIVRALPENWVEETRGILKNT